MTGVNDWMMAAAFVSGASLLAVARSRRWLKGEALPAAGAVGLGVLAGTGAGGVSLLLVFLVSTSVLTRFRGGKKARNGAEHDVGSGGRSARQVWANGGVAAACAVLALVPGLRSLAAGVAGALAAALADSWATEIGTAVRGRTVLVTTFRAVSPGTSGGVSLVGTLAGLAGSGLAGGLVALGQNAWAVSWAPPAGSTAPPPWPEVGGGPSVWLAVALAGAVGMVADSILGATVENRSPWIDNETVNLLATLTGAVVAVLTVRA